LTANTKSGGVWCTQPSTAEGDASR
jgi:hypothetical protein